MKEDLAVELRHEEALELISTVSIIEAEHVVEGPQEVREDVFDEQSPQIWFKFL